MSKVQMLRALVQQRLTAAAEEIFGLFERTIAEYEEELCRSKEENERQQKLLDAVFNPQLRLHTADVQQLSVVKEEVPPEQQECSSSLDQDPEPPHIKEEQEELWSSQEGEQLQGLEEADIIKFTFTPVPVKSEAKEEKPQSSQMETEADGEDCGGPGPDRNSHPDTHITPETEDKTGDSSETDNSDDWTVPSESQPALKPNKVPVSDEGCHTGLKPFSCPVCKKCFKYRAAFVKHKRLHTREKASISCFSETKQSGSNSLKDVEVPASDSRCREKPDRNSHPDTDLTPETEDKTGDSSEPETDDSDDWKETREPQSGSNSLKDVEVPVSESRCSAGEKPFLCLECGKRFGRKRSLKRHMRTHTGEKPFNCSVCDQRFLQNAHLKRHMITHTGEKPFSCSVCTKSFTQNGTLQTHMIIHTGGKPFSCSVCKKTFTLSRYLQTHMRIHTGEKLSSCSVCGKVFTENGSLKKHMRSHTEEKPFSCSVCKKSFAQSAHLQKHMRTHKREKRFSCSVCNERFGWRHQVKTHKCQSVASSRGDRRRRASSQQLK